MQKDFKNTFKYLIKDFHESKTPLFSFERELILPQNPKKVIVVYGPRRCGKTFYFYNLINKFTNTGVEKEQIIYLNFEDDRLLNIKASDLDSLLEAYYELYPQNINAKLFFFFDEIQLINSWEYFVRRLYDTVNCNLYITGSSAKLLSKEIATNLRGRCLSYALYPLSFREFLKFKKVEQKENYKYGKERFKIKKLLNEYIEFGTFPEVALTEENEIKKKILKEYYESLVYKDLLDRYSLKNTELLKDLLRFLFTNITKEFSVNSYYKAVKNNLTVSRETITEYLDCIQETSYFSFTPLFSYSLKMQRVNPKKIISLDNGLRNRICFRTSEDLGKLAENLIGINLVSKFEEVFYWKDKHEVDFVIKDENGYLHAFNVSYGNEIPEREYTSLIEFKKSHKNIRSLTIISNDIQAKKDSIQAVPLIKYLLE